jgi:hypothetical protein
MKLLGLGFAVLFFAIGSARSQSTSTTIVRNSQAVAILQGSFTAMGGVTASRISTVLMSGQMTRQLALTQATGTVTFKWGGANLCRLDLASDTYSHSFVVNGTQGTQVEDGVSMRVPAHMLINHPLKYLPVLSEVSSFADPNYSISYVRLETLNGGSVHHIHMESVLPGLSPQMAALYSKLTGVELYIDANTLLLVKRAQEVPTFLDMGTTALVEQYFSAYQVNKGISVPYQISVYLSGTKLMDMQITSVQFDAGVSTADFEVQQ